jgi:hypothetical protein
LVGFATLLSNNITGPQVMLPSFLSENYPLYINTLGSLNLQLVANFRARQKRVFEPDAATQEAPIAQPSTSVNPLIQAGVKPTDMAGNAAKDIQMAAESTQFIGFQSGTATVSSTNKYKKAWGDKANTGTYSSNDVIMVSGSGLFRGVTEAQIRETLTNKYKPLLEKAVAAEASFRVGNRYEKGNLSDQLISQYLKSKGYTEQKLEGYSRWTLEKVKPSQNDINNLPNIEPCGG